ncbi:MAG: FAD-binding oxidoreductase [Myxococcales bacterium]|jgi:alkyldihydroxyacetonephosphate synthase|nr:FAD-binding oxidoreductase [Myxococcales bacterium]
MRARSHWAWGYEDRLPDAGKQRALAERVAFVLGKPVAPREATPLAAARVPEPEAPIPDAVRAFASADRESRARHTWGRAYPDIARGFAGDFSAAPDLVITPRSEDEVAIAIEACDRARYALVPWGGGTSVVGGVEHRRDPRFAGRATLDLANLSRVLEIDEVSRAARIEAGASGPALDAALEPRGLSLRHFPQSYEHSTLGGWIATRAGGHFATVYTHIDDLVESVRVLCPRGAIETRRLPASGAGPSPERLFLGSEGTLGVITSAWMRVFAAPRFRASASVHFREHAAAVDATRAIAQSGLFPSNCRLLDAREAMLHEVALDGTSVLLLAFESADHPLGPWIERAVAIAAAHGGECRVGPLTAEAGERTHERAAGAEASWRRAFFDAPYMQSALVGMGLVADTFETACTWDRFDALHQSIVRATKDALARTSGGGVVSCRFTHVYPDGPAPYYTFVGAPAGEAIEAWREIKRAAMDAIVAGGGTITHHHAVGRTHREHHERERAPLFGDALRAVKATLDPGGILNPGVLW